MERLAPLSRRGSEEPLQIEPLERPVDALAFVNDPATAEILAALLGATALGRVQFGGLEAAIQVLQSAPCPQLLIVDISGLLDPLAHLDRLAEFCPEGTGVVVVGDSQDPALAAELQAMGVFHYLAKPIDPERAREAMMEAATSASDLETHPHGFGNHAAAPGYEGELAANAGNHPSAGAPAIANGFPSSNESMPAHEMTPIEPRAGAVDYANEPVQPSPENTREGSAGESDRMTFEDGAQIPPPATIQMPPFAAGSAATMDIEPLPRPVDLLAFMAEAQSASLVAAILGPHGAAGRVQPGGINAAISFLRDNASPRILLVDLSGVIEPMSRIDALAEVCAPGTMVIATGAANDVALYRDLKNAGIYEYLVKPIQPETLKTIVLEAASGGMKIEPDANKPILMVIGTRGGVGASTVAINLAGTLAKQGKKTILLDLDLQFGSIALALDIDPGHGLREALDRPDRVDSMFLNGSAVKVAENLHVLAAEEAVSDAVTVTCDSLIALLQELQRHFGAIVVDMPRHVIAGNWDAVAYAQAVLLVADLSLAGIRDTTRMLAASKETVDPAKIKLMVSNAGGERGAKIDRKEFETALNHKADYVIPDDPKSVSAANRAGRTVVDVAAGSRLASALREICIDALGQPEAEAVAKRRGISLFRRKAKE